MMTLPSGILVSIVEKDSQDVITTLVSVEIPPLNVMVSIEKIIGHKNAHEGKKPHQCKYCGQGFARQYDCRRHERDHCLLRPVPPASP
jgi:hypothetical protein